MSSSEEKIGKLQEALRDPNHPWRRDSVATLFEQLQEVQTEMQRTKSENSKLKTELALLQATEKVSVNSHRASFERTARPKRTGSKKKESPNKSGWESLFDSIGWEKEDTEASISSLSDTEPLETPSKTPVKIKEVSINKNNANANICFDYSCLFDRGPTAESSTPTQCFCFTTSAMHPLFEADDDLTTVATTPRATTSSLYERSSFR